MEFKWYETEALVKFASPCNICVIGNTGIDKTFFTRKLLENADGMCTQKVQKIIYFHGSTFQPIFKEMEKNISNIHFYEGLPAEEKEFLSLIATEGHKICVFDDLMLEISNKNWTEKIFTTHGHHKNTTLIYIMQNPLQKGKNARGISINQHYSVPDPRGGGGGQKGHMPPLSDHKAYLAPPPPPPPPPRKKS